MVCTACAQAQDQALNARISGQFKSIMGLSREFPRELDFKWLDGGDAYTVIEPTADGKGQEIAVYETNTGKRSVLVTAVQLTPPNADKALDIEDYFWSADKKKLLIFTNSKRVWRMNTRGDYWVLDLEAGSNTKLSKLGGDAPESTMMFATFSPESTRVAWVRANNLYLQELASGKITQLTSDGSADIINGTSDWVNEEELDLRNCFRWSPDSKSIAYWQFDQSGVGEFTLINDTEQLYPVTTKYKYPLVGTTNSAVRVGIVPASGGSTQWVKLEGDARQHYVAEIAWAADSRSLLLEYLDRLQQTNQFIQADPLTGQGHVLGADTDKAWVDVFGLNWVPRNSGSAKDMLFISERDGWRHAWRMDLSNGETRLVTNFKGDISRESIGVRPADSAEWVYFMASPHDAARLYLYRARVDGKGSPEQITPADQTGDHTYDISPNGRWAVHHWTTNDGPIGYEMVSLPDHKTVRQLADYSAVTSKIQPLLGSKTEFFQVKVSGDLSIDGMMIKPPDFDATKKYPVIVNVYGEPAAALVRDGFSRGRLMDGIFARDGYLVIRFDNQGTPSLKGREWRKSIYGAVGMLSSQQQVEAIQNLAKARPYIDTARMGIWGWSGGGSNTLNVMFRYPGVFTTGVAVAPVPDEARYDTIYQERYMGLPATNAKGFHDGSPISFAEGLAGNLLIIHGSGDDNVHFQGTELLLNRLIELGKPFDFMDYPNRSHGIYEGPGTSLHVYTRIASYLEGHIPAGALPQ